LEGIERLQSRETIESRSADQTEGGQDVWKPQNEAHARVFWAHISAQEGQQVVKGEVAGRGGVRLHVLGRCSRARALPHCKWRAETFKRVAETGPRLANAVGKGRLSLTDFLPEVEK
jgi:hypothetical protein